MGNIFGSKLVPNSGSIPKTTGQDERKGDAGQTDPDLQAPACQLQRNDPDLQAPACQLQRNDLDLQAPACQLQCSACRARILGRQLLYLDDDFQRERWLSEELGNDVQLERRSSYSLGRVWERLSRAFDYFAENVHLDPPVPVQTSAPVIHGTEVLLSAGTYEVELNWEGVNELDNLKQRCPKNAGHDNFIPVHEFGPEHLPALYRNDLIIDLVRCMSTLTVRLRVDKISLSRPNPPYPPKRRRDHLGRDCSINGTGHVTSTVVCSEATDALCACPECLKSGNPVRSFAKIFIQTAAHVVHDDLEAANTTCYFNYLNDIDGLDTAVKVQGTKGVQIDVKEDRCWMFGYTHNLSLAKKLGVMSENYQRLRTDVSDKYCVNWSDTPEDKLTIIVSHPHGCSKYVTVGDMQGRLAAPDDADWTQYSYTTPTCPGSSGAPIFMLGKHGYIDNHHHSGAVSGTGLNVSTFGLF